jgi:hypothetical protein
VSKVAWCCLDRNFCAVFVLWFAAELFWEGNHLLTVERTGQHERWKGCLAGVGQWQRKLPDILFAEHLMRSCYEMYRQTPLGLAPEIVVFEERGDSKVTVLHSFRCCPAD